MSEQVAEVANTGRVAPAARWRPSPSLARRLAWLAIAGQVVFVASWIVAGALEPGYSHLREGVSALGARDAAHPWIVNTGFVVLGLAIAALGVSLLAALPRRRATTVAAALFVASGAAIALIAAFPVDCSLTPGSVCTARFNAGLLSWRTDVHLWLSLVFDVLFLVTPFAIARALWPSPVAALSLGSGLFGVGFTALSFAVGDDAATGGLVQRMGLLTMHLWVLIVAVGVLHTLASKQRPGVLIPVRPRDFFGRAWAGRGAVFLHPAFIWRRFPLGIDFRRETRWLSDDAWVVEDTTTFDTGYAIERRMVCVMNGPDRVDVTADDMPGGAELELTEGGYRVRPYKLAFPIGPLRFALTCHDRVHEHPDGSLDWTIAFRWHGLPASRLEGRVGAVEQSPRQ